MDTPEAGQAPLFMLAFDHRRSIRPLFGIDAEPDRSGSARIAAAKMLIGDGLLAAARSLEGGTAALLVDEQFGARVLDVARAEPVITALACERSGQAEFQFEYGDDFGAHIERFDPGLVKALVRFNPDGDPELNRRQVERVRRLGRWLADRDRKLLFELLVPPERDQLRAVGDDRDRFDADLRPELVRRAVIELQDAGVEPAVWKIEGIEDRLGCELVAAACRRQGRDHVGCLILGRGADESRVEHWLRVAAPVDGFEGFAVGRTIWWDAIGSHLAGELGREEAVAQIATRYLRFADVYLAAMREPARG